MFEYAIKDLKTLRDFIYDNLPNNALYDNTKIIEEDKKKIKELEAAIKVLQGLDESDIKSRLLNVLQENFMFNSYGEFNEIETKQYKNCINSILKELGIEDKVYNI